MKIGKAERENAQMPKDDRLIFLVFTAQQKLRTYLKNAMSEAGATITPAQSGILFLLKKKNGQTMSELTQVLSIDNSTLTGLVDRLERAGFVKRNAGRLDRRASHVFITDRGGEEIDRAQSRDPPGERTDQGGFHGERGRGIQENPEILLREIRGATVR